MKTQKIAFFDTKPYDQQFFDAINKEFGFEINYYAEHLNQNTIGLVRGAEVVCIFVNDNVDKAIAEALTKNGVRLIALRSAGYNNINLKAVYGKIHVVRVPAYSPYAVAEHAAALMLSLNRKTHRAYARVKEGNFSIQGFLGFDMHGKNAGIIGTGKIGRCLIAILKGFGMNVVAFDPHPDTAYAKKVGVRYVGLPELYKQSDIISLHCPLTPTTYHMINQASIAKMKSGVMLINTGRGKLVDTKALIKGLKSAKIGAAGLDVYEEESEYFFEDWSSTMISDDTLARLLVFPNVLITSHQGFFTNEALANIAATTLENIAEFFKGGYLTNEVCYRCNGACRKKQKKQCF